MNTSKAVAEKPATKTAELNANAPKISIPKDPVVIPGIVAEKREDVTTKKVVPSIEDRLKKLEEINELAERREVVTDAIQNLSGFYISPEGSGCNLRLQDSKGKTFAIAHPSVIGEMVAMAKEKLSAELARIENLMDFTI